MFRVPFGVANNFYIPIIKRSVVDFAVSADWTPATGDVKYSIDAGNFANVTNLPTILGGTGAAMWRFQLTAGELTGKNIVVQIVDSATKAIEDQAFAIQTFGHHLAMNTEGIGRAGTAQGYAAQTVVLDVTASTVDGYYTGWLFVITDTVAGTMAGTCIDYTASSKTCIMDRAWPVTPSGTVTFIGYPGSLSATDVEQATTNWNVTSSELGSVPGPSATNQDKLNWAFMFLRNAMTRTTTQQKLYADDGTTIVGTSAITDVGGTLTSGEFI